MFWTSCFYVMIALISLFVINKFKENKPQRKVYTRVELLKEDKTATLPSDWTPLNVVKTEEKTQSPVKTEVTLESFILKEIENSVKELEQKRVPFGKIDTNVMKTRLNPTVEEFLPKVRLNPMAQDFHPFQ